MLELDSHTLWEPLQVLLLSAFVDECLDSIVLSLVLSSEFFEVKHIVPDSMITSIVINESISVSLKLL